MEEDEPMKETEKAGEKLVHCYLAEFKGTEGSKKKWPNVFQRSK